MSAPAHDPSRLRHDLREAIEKIIHNSAQLESQAAQLGEAGFAETLQKLRAAGEELIALLNVLIGPSKTQAADLNVEELLFQLRTALHHTIGYIELLQEEAAATAHVGLQKAFAEMRESAGGLLTLMFRALLPPPAAEATAPGLESEPDRAAILASLKRTPLTDESSTASGATVLIVDGDAPARYALGQQLGRRGFKITEEGDGERALHTLRAHPHDVVLLKLRDGAAILAAIREDAACGNPATIIVATPDQQAAAAECVLAGADDFLITPADVILVEARIAICLEVRRARTLREQRDAERRSNDRLVRNAMPGAIAGRLRAGAGALAENFPNTVALVAELTEVVPHHGSSPDEMARGFDEIVSAFDGLVEQHGAEKLPAFGALYVAVMGVPAAHENDAAKLVNLALAMQAETRRMSERFAALTLRIGIHSGAAFGGIAGRVKFSYAIHGEAVSIADLLRTHAVPGGILVSAEVRRRAETSVRCEEHPPVTTLAGESVPAFAVFAAAES